MIHCEGLWKRFGAKEVLRGVDLAIPDGQAITIIGRSGSGKSVLLKHLIGLIPPDRGRVLVDDQDLAKLPYDELNEVRRRFGMLFQMAALFDSMTVGENVGLALKEHTKLKRAEIATRVAEKLAMVGLPGLEDLKPSSLSGGMRKRVGLARAIAMEPRCVLYDEPTTGLDPITSDTINVLIKSLQQKLGITSIVVTHDMKSAAYVSDRICMLHDGQLIFDGSFPEIEASPDPRVQQFITGSSHGPLTDDAPMITTRKNR
ncbi:MAG: ABC transporter ATP-binding protein [Candidatus Eisenbacteria bacterium]|nr:ABC transporter ATP-binding protein [Candidatus Eisenbacteria bacterium]